MSTKTKLMMMTAAVMISGAAAFAQDTTPVDPVTPPVDPVVTPAPFDFSFLEGLFTGDTAPDQDAITAAFEGAGLTVERLRLRGDGSVRVEATTADGERVRVIVKDGEVRYRIKDASDTSDANSDDTSDSNGDNSDDSSDSNGDDSSDGNGGSSGGSNSGGNGGSTGGGSSDD
ncbi:MAG: hypothetical protein RLZZ563_1531 [Pseudomonadota bacterium]